MVQQTVLILNLIFFILLCSCNCKPNEPLFLTPYIEKGEIETARNLSQVSDFNLKVKSYSGFITVNKQYDSNFFFWYFPAVHADPNAPLLLWLQGGPGSSSMLGLFLEHGPFKLNKNLVLSRRKYSWNNKYNVLYLDNPVGTGFSFTKDDRGFARNQNDVAKNVFKFLKQFYQIFPELKPVKFYVTGESYGGKYVPSVAYFIHNMNMKVKDKINLAGIAIGNGLTDPISQIDYGSFLFHIGLIDEIQRDYFDKQRDKARSFIQNEEWLKAFRVFDEMINGDKFKNPTAFKNFTGLNYYLNYLKTEQPEDFNYFPSFLNKNETRQAIHVGNLKFHDPSKVESHLLEDVTKSVKPELTTLMNNYKVLIYSGNLDIIVPTSSTENLIHGIDWKFADEYSSSKRNVYKVNKKDSEVAGYVKICRDFVFVVVRNAGHLVPFSQPRTAFDMISRFVDGRKFHSNL